ncbi:hypothetical protein ACFXHA_21875 [Nocardia sp. NPDC059240]|uniref:hypothetical protein n=1 Tax=Nocardia sp. NPDC059240 TaxID=3346786 RepID=UPI0036BA26DE
MSYPYDQSGHSAAGYGYPPQVRASGGTAIAAGVLAMIVGALSLLAAIALIGFVISESCRDNSYTSRQYSVEGFGIFLVVVGIFVALVGAVWVLGAVLLFMRRPGGRALLIALGSLAIVIEAIQIGLIGSLVSGLGLLLAISIVVLASVPSTGRWIDAGSRQ